MQGEEALAEDNQEIGSFLIDIITPNKAHEKAVNVSMKIDDNGILTVKATDI